jgi:broad specificity phosphatase PhoE
MPKLILVRHAAPATDACVAPNQWPLSDAGRQSVHALAQALTPFWPAVLVSSREAKAAETAALLARELGTRYTTAPGLQEHARASVGWLSDQEFEAGIASLFARPSEAVFGDESADQAYARFRAAVSGVLDQHPEENVALVTHGTVMTLLITRAQQAPAEQDPRAFWKRLSLPAMAVLSRPDWRLEQLIEKVEVDGHQVG